MSQAITSSTIVLDVPKPSHILRLILSYLPRVFILGLFAAWIINLSTITFPDTVGYGLKRLIYTTDEIAEMRAVDAMLTHIQIVRVACGDASMSLAERQQWMTHAAGQGWPAYPQAGAACVRPTETVPGYYNFMVACPTVAFSVADQQRWANYTSQHHWDPYPQAGQSCVDP